MHRTTPLNQLAWNKKTRQKRTLRYANSHTLSAPISKYTRCNYYFGRIKYARRRMQGAHTHTVVSFFGVAYLMFVGCIFSENAIDRWIGHNSIKSIISISMNFSVPFANGHIDATRWMRLKFNATSDILHFSFGSNFSTIMAIAIAIALHSSWLQLHFSFFSRKLHTANKIDGGIVCDSSFLPKLWIYGYLLVGLDSVWIYSMRKTQLNRGNKCRRDEN